MVEIAVASWSTATSYGLHQHLPKDGRRVGLRGRAISFVEALAASPHRQMKTPGCVTWQIGGERIGEAEFAQGGFNPGLVYEANDMSQGVVFFRRRGRSRPALQGSGQIVDADLVEFGSAATPEHGAEHLPVVLKAGPIRLHNKLVQTDLVFDDAGQGAIIADSRALTKQALDFRRAGSIPADMNAQAVPEDLDPMFEALLDALGEALELSVLPDRDSRLVEIADYCATAARLTYEALKRR